MARLLAVALLTTLVALLAAVPSWASCVEDERPLEERIEEATHVWKGTVTGSQEGGRVAIVQVEEVWKGEGPDGERVRILADSEEPTSTDRTWTVDQTYLIFPRPEEDGEWHDSACSATREWSGDLASLRPTGAGTAATGGEEEEPDSGPRSLVLVAIFAGVLGLAGLAFRRSRA